MVCATCCHICQWYLPLFAKEDLPDGIYIRLRSDVSLFNLRRLLARTKTIEELITDLLFADDCGLLAHTEQALQHIVNHFSDAAKDWLSLLTISLRKTEVLYQVPSRETYISRHISIDGTNLNAVEHFTYLGSVISSDATVSKNLDNCLSKANSCFGRLSKRVWQSHSLRLSTKIQVYGAVAVPTLPVRCRDLGSLTEADQATGAVSPMLLELHTWHQMARPRVERRSPLESQPSQHRVHLAAGVATMGWPRHKGRRRTHAKSSLLQRTPRRKTRSWCSKKALQR